MNKMFLQILDNDGQIVSSKSYKSLRELNTDYKEIPYTSLRAIYLKSVNSKTKLHRFNEHLYKTMRISNGDDEL